MEIKEAIKMLGALAQESRLATFRLLVVSGQEGLCAGTIAERLQVPPATLSFHLKELMNAGLVDQRRDGRSLIYALNVAAMRSLMEYLLKDCCQGRPELCLPCPESSVATQSEIDPRALRKSKREPGEQPPRVSGVRRSRVQ